VPVTRAAAVAVVAAVAAVVAVLAIAVAGCSGSSAYSCTSSSQCVAGGAQGTCTGGYCAFPDPSCPGGLRYEENAGGGLGGTCPELLPDAGACGAAGQACCASEPPCGPGTSCRGGTCTACASGVALGRRFSCVLAHDGTVRCAGANDRGQLGFGIAGVPSATRMQVRDAAASVIADATAVGAGREHACAVRAGGTVWCWGRNDHGQLGNNAPVNAPPQPAAVQVVTATGPLTGIVEVGGGYDFTCARDGGGGVWCWGEDGAGELGDGTTATRGRAARVLDAPMGPPLAGALELQVGNAMSCVRKAGDAWWCWGKNSNGQFGDGTKTNHPSPVMIGAAASVALGMWHACLLDAAGTVRCAGWNGHARLGIGRGAGYQDGDHTAKEQVVTAPGGPAFADAVAIAAGGATCAITRDTGVACWGDNLYGQTGTGQGEIVPTKVRDVDGSPLAGVERLIAGYAHVCARKATGELVCWGRNNDGELGDGTFGNRGFPSPLQGACP
jgi:alpha-tubulin suppressor-like RCC1 family protein